MQAGLVEITHRNIMYAFSKFIQQNSRNILIYKVFLICGALVGAVLQSCAASEVKHELMHKTKLFGTNELSLFYWEVDDDGP